MYNVINNNNLSSNANKTYVIDNISDDTFAPVESTFIENQLRSECEINDNADNNSDTSVISQNSDESFHLVLSDCSMLENTDKEDEDETESTHEYSKNETVDSTNLTPSRSSFKVCDDRNMYVETSENPKSKLAMCPYCKQFQTQFARHLESIHKTEEDVKKFRLLPKGKLYVIYKVANNI